MHNKVRTSFSGMRRVSLAPNQMPGTEPTNNQPNNPPTHMAQGGVADASNQGPLFRALFSTETVTVGSAYIFENYIFVL
jgi:hypothetical protein